MANVEDIEGVGAASAAKLETAGVKTIEGLLSAGGTPKGRAELAEKTGISDKLILKWVNHADLIRIKGIGPETAELLEASGVDSVKELAQRNATNLRAKMQEVNDVKELVRQLPSESQVQGFIDEAKALPGAVSH